MKPPSGPTARGGAVMAYDAKADRIILFGGTSATQYDLPDTWAYNYNTNTWTKLAYGPGRTWGGMVYDSASDRIILFGGGLWDYGGVYNDTWAYDYNTNTWTDMKPSTSPSARSGQVMAYDAKADRVIMWGGDTGWEDQGLPKDQSVWSYAYNTNTWQETKPGTGMWPDCRDDAAMAYDAKSDRMIMTGGYDDKGTAETWAYDYNPNTWTKLEPNTAGGMLAGSAMVYSPATDRIILFGGGVGGSDSNYTAETWSYDFNANAWTDVTPHS
ncbi:MAG: kelch repeat-containing protein [Anaerolineales bacterium]